MRPQAEPLRGHQVPGEQSRKIVLNHALGICVLRDAPRTQVFSKAAEMEHLFEIFYTSHIPIIDAFGKAGFFEHTFHIVDPRYVPCCKVSIEMGACERVTHALHVFGIPLGNASSKTTIGKHSIQRVNIGNINVVQAAPIAMAFDGVRNEASQMRGVGRNHDRRGHVVAGLSNASEGKGTFISAVMAGALACHCTQASAAISGGVPCMRLNHAANSGGVDARGAGPSKNA